MKTDDPLDRFLREVRDDVRAQADHGGRVRDFAAMIGRARDLDASAVSAEDLAEVRRYAPVIALHFPTAPRREPAPATTDTLAVATIAPPRTASRSWWLGGLLAAAAIVVCVVGASRLVQRDDDRAGHAVQHSTASAPAMVPVEAAPERERAPAAAPRRDAIATPPPIEPPEDPPPPAQPEAPPSQEVPEDMSPKTPSQAAVNVHKDRSKKPAVEPPPAPAPWLELDRLAHDAWRRGDLVQARRLLAALIDSEAPADRIELAFGDLFVLARQTGDLPRLERAWRAYLARFPGGLFAEDASAGLCRRKADGDCWHHYLARWPDGTHAREAREATGDLE